MSSRFVSAGAIDPTTGEAAPATAEDSKHNSRADAGSNKPNDEWLAVEKELAAERRRRDEARSAAATGREPSLFEVLQANKEAKQAAFEEANKIKNQFRALDDDEIDFLDEVKARQREEEDRVKRETEERVAAFRAAQKTTTERVSEGEEGDDGDGGEGAGEWAATTAGRKRKRVERRGVGLVKRRTTSQGEGEKGKVAGEKKEGEKGEERKEEGNKKGEPEAKVAEKPAAAMAPSATAKPKMGLVSYDSDSDD
ncbi:N-terminal domain of NEFA-interacting nuclear protein NIP30-domain-containing protein [Coniochaeta sp. 2T2.1]|nr:N-terminal domain of NEFA-interacting nuclear protein NIP30-domain-containing protein [Coniochaeta sp. 2T2.1]